MSGVENMRLILELFKKIYLSTFSWSKLGMSMFKVSVLVSCKNCVDISKRGRRSSLIKCYLTVEPVNLIKMSFKNLIYLFSKIGTFIYLKIKAVKISNFSIVRWCSFGSLEAFALPSYVISFEL